MKNWIKLRFDISHHFLSIAAPAIRRVKWCTKSRSQCHMQKLVNWKWLFGNEICLSRLTLVTCWAWPTVITATTTLNEHIWFHDTIATTCWRWTARNWMKSIADAINSWCDNFGSLLTKLRLRFQSAAESFCLGKKRPIKLSLHKMWRRFYEMLNPTKASTATVQLMVQIG